MKAQYNYIDNCNGYDIYLVKASYGTFYSCCIEGEDPDIYGENDEDTLQKILEWCECH